NFFGLVGARIAFKIVTSPEGGRLTSRERRPVAIAKDATNGRALRNGGPPVRRINHAFPRDLLLVPRPGARRWFPCLGAVGPSTLAAPARPVWDVCQHLKRRSLRGHSPGQGLRVCQRERHPCPVPLRCP